MAFVQVIEMRTSKIDEILRLQAEYWAATEGKRTVRRAIVARDRHDQDRHFVIAFFDSYESAMENSNLPETAEFAHKQNAFVDAPPTFIDLDVLEDNAG